MSGTCEDCGNTECVCRAIAADRAGFDLLEPITDADAHAVTAAIGPSHVWIHLDERLIPTLGIAADHADLPPPPRQGSHRAGQVIGALAAADARATAAERLVVEQERQIADLDRATRNAWARIDAITDAAGVSGPHERVAPSEAAAAVRTRVSELEASIAALQSQLASESRAIAKAREARLVAAIHDLLTLLKAHGFEWERAVREARAEVGS